MNHFAMLFRPTLAAISCFVAAKVLSIPANGSPLYWYVVILTLLGVAIGFRSRLEFTGWWLLGLLIPPCGSWWIAHRFC